jgi:hypothetical protein
MFVTLGNEESGALCRIGFGRIRFLSCERISADKVFVKIKNDRDNNEDLRWGRDELLGALDDANAFQIYWVKMEGKK